MTRTARGFKPKLKQKHVAKMKLLTYSVVKICRTLLSVAALLIIPFLFIQTVFERAGGGTERMKFLLFPLVCILTIFSYVLHRRKKDKENAKQSNTILIGIETIAVLASLTISCFTMYAMFTWDFEFVIFIILLFMICISGIILFDCIYDLKGKKV